MILTLPSNGYLLGETGDEEYYDLCGVKNAFSAIIWI